MPSFFFYEGEPHTIPMFLFFPPTVLKIRACAQPSVEPFPVQIESVSKGEERKKMNYKLPEVGRGGGCV